MLKKQFFKNHLSHYYVILIQSNYISININVTTTTG